MGYASKRAFTDVQIGVAEAGKVLVLGAGKTVDALDVTALTADAADIAALTINGLLVIATAIEMDVIASVTPGTSAAGKAVVLGAGSEIDAIDITALSLGTVPVTAIAVEINVLAGVTPGIAAVNSALVLGATGEIDALDITALLLGGTPVTATADEINVLASVTPGTADALCAVVLDAASKIDVMDIGDLVVRGVARGLTAGDGLDAAAVADYAPAGVIGATPVLYHIATAGGATADTDLTLPVGHKIRVVDAWAVLKGVGTAADTIQLKSTASVMTNAIDINVGDTTRVALTTILDNIAVVNGGGILRVTETDGGGNDSPAVDVFILAYRVA